ncbi:MAG: DNA repair photolyase [Desulforhopalus sp.]|jgi:DNA repair photolyase
MSGKGVIRGTREWAVAEINCSRGCPHGCLYCYARYNQVTRKGLVTASEWNHPQDLKEEVDKEHPLFDGQVMFPAAHDIVPENIESCVKVLKNLLDAGNNVLVVSKPHLNCIQRLCQEFYSDRERVLFRFTITARDQQILKFWEHEAPDYQERLMCLRSSFERGFATSVSVEPMLHREDVVAMVQELLPFVSQSVWIGKMNKIDKRLVSDSEQMKVEIERIQRGQSDEQIHLLYQELQGIEKIRWKESIKEVLGLTLPTQAGLDI